MLPANNSGIVCDRSGAGSEVVAEGSPPAAGYPSARFKFSIASSTSALFL